MKNLVERARQLCQVNGVDPDSKREDGSPAWLAYRALAKAQDVPPVQGVVGQDSAYADASLKVIGEHEGSTLTQMRVCMQTGNTVAGVLCADGHLGYAQPVGGVIAYEKQISISGVGFDIGCGNMAVRLDTHYNQVKDRLPEIMQDIVRVVSFGVGRVNNDRVEHPLFDDAEAWAASGMEFYRQKAEAQLGTVGAGNHYVDLLTDAGGCVWIGVHFGSRGLGHTTATRYIKAAGGKDGIHVAPAVVAEETELGARYIAAMGLAGRYAYAGREWVVEQVRRIIGGQVTETVHNHHNYAWKERHGGRDLWVVRKGATPAFPGQRGFVGGSMGDPAVILEGVEGPESEAALYSTVHGAGRTFGRMEAKRRFKRSEMDAWLKSRGVTLIGGDLDESPMAYRRLPDVLKFHDGMVKWVYCLQPFAVMMAGEGMVDPFKD